MSRLYRPHITLEIRCRVALRQLGFNSSIDDLLKMHRPDKRPRFKGTTGYGHLLKRLLAKLAEKLKCDVKDLRLDHDPALGARPKFRRGLGKKTRYEPDANDPNYLIYREHHAHHIKTNIRGDGAQYPDRVLIKRQRKHEQPKRAKPKRKWPSRPFPKRQSR
jgi:hypothetical protein